MQLEEDKETDDEADPYAYLAEEDEDPLRGKVLTKKVRNLNRTWLSVTPAANDFNDAINDALL